MHKVEVSATVSRFARVMRGTIPLYLRVQGIRGRVALKTGLCICRCGR